MIEDFPLSSIATILDLYEFSNDQSHNLIEALKIAGDAQNFTYFKNIDHINKDYKEALDEFNLELQKSFKRPAGQERQQMEDLFKDEETRAKLIALLDEIFIKAVNDGEDVKIKLLLGASEQTIVRRLDNLARLENNTCHSEIVYILSGQRDLWIDHEPIAKEMLIEKLIQQQNLSKAEAKLEIEASINNFFSNQASQTNLNKKREAIVGYFTNNGIEWPSETEMIERIFSQYRELAQTQYILVDTPKKLDKHNNLVRPDTLDTFKQFWQDQQKTITLKPNERLPVAIISSQPHARYQYQQAVAALYNQPIDIFVVANSNPENLNLSEIFDSFARIIYAGREIALEKIKRIKNETL